MDVVQCFLLFVVLGCMLFHKQIGMLFTIFKEAKHMPAEEKAMLKKVLHWNIWAICGVLFVAICIIKDMSSS